MLHQGRMLKRRYGQAKQRQTARQKEIERQVALSIAGLSYPTVKSEPSWLRDVTSPSAVACSSTSKPQPRPTGSRRCPDGIRRLSRRAVRTTERSSQPPKRN